jgi:hypothetical protein
MSQSRDSETMQGAAKKTITSDDMHAFVTNDAMHGLLRLPKVRMGMRGITRPKFVDIMVTRPGREVGVTVKHDRERRLMYADCYHTMRETNNQAPHGFVTTHRESDNQLLSFVPFLQYKQGEEIVFAFHSEMYDKTALLVVEDEADMPNANCFISTYGDSYDFSGVCSFCGTHGRYRKCPCKMTEYCSPKCQKQHWKAHKTICTHVKA